MGQIQAQHRHLTGTLPVARPTSSPSVPVTRVVLLEGAGLVSGGAGLVGVSGCGQGIAKHDEVRAWEAVAPNCCQRLAASVRWLMAWS